MCLVLFICKIFSVSGILNEWSKWSACDKTCGLGIKVKSRNCTGPFYGGINCTRHLREERNCFIIACPIDGYFEEWTKWGKCTVSCGEGKRFRNRKCHGPYYNGRNCSGVWSDAENCNKKQCPINGIFSNWSTWSKCSVSCGQGFKQRLRTCLGPFYGGKYCRGNDTDNELCFLKNCPGNSTK